MNDEEKRPIVVKRVKRHGGGGHAAAWKIAYADFVTAMMAFFLLMWLLGSVTKGDLQGIADYFQTPLRVALAGGSGSGDSSSVIKGGGMDLTRTDGQVKKGETPKERKTVNLQAAKAELARQETQRLTSLKNKIEAAIGASPALRSFAQQIRVELTADGLRIQVSDEQNRPMFDSGSAVLNVHMREILHELAGLLNDVPNRISLAGHTDAKPYAGGERGYSNWELSADRANASRRQLVAGGIADDKILRVVGLASAVPHDRNDPNHPLNRRISITVLNQQAEQRILGEEPTANTAPAGPAEQTAAPVDAAPGARAPAMAN